MTSASECLAAIDAAANGKLSDDEIENLLEELARVQQRRSAGEKLESLEGQFFDKAEQIGADVQISAAIEKRNRLINIIREGQIMDLARRTNEALDDPSMGLEAAMVGINSPIEGGRLSVDARANALLRGYMGGLVADLRDAGLLGIYNSKAIQRDIARELWDLSIESPTGRASSSKDAKTIAKLIHKYRRSAIERENRAGAYIRYRQGYITRQTHDRRRMEKAGAQVWSDDVGSKVDWDAMEIAPEDRAGFLQSAWEALVTGVRKDAAGGDENDLQFVFKGPGNLAKKDSQSRVIVFKSADDWFSYNEKFGMRSLSEAVNDDFRRAAQNTALMEGFGTNPRAMFEKVRDALKEKHRSEPDKVRKLDRSTLEWQFSEIDGSVNHAKWLGLAGFGRGVRAIQTMAKLGGAVISSVTDLAAVASERRYQGRNLLDTWGDAFRAPMEGLTAESEKKRFAELIGVGIDGVLGDFVSRFSAQDDAPGRISKAMSLYFKLNLLGPWTDGVKRGAGLMLARDLAMNSDMQIGRLPDEMQRMLGMYGIDDRKWEIARKAIVKAPDGRKYLLPGEIENTSGNPFKGLSERQQRALKDDVTTAIRTMITDRTEFASPTPGARERALLRAGLQPGTGWGEAVRFLMQFKAFPITVISKLQGRDLYGGGAKTLSDALLRGQGDLLGMTSYIAGATVLGYFALQAKEVAKGREFRENDAATFTASIMQGGGLGIYGDFLLGETNRFGRSLLDTIAGPTFGGVADLDSIRASAMAGEDAWAKVAKFVQSNTPGVNLFYTKAALDYMIFYQLQEMTNPGYLRRMERRMKRENNQRFLLPPSQAIPRGGGSRVFEGIR